MAQLQPAYVEPWDAAEFPFHRERSGLVRYHQRVVVTFDADGEPADVISGHHAVASAIAESWCAANPQLFEALVDEWIENARAADDADKDWRRRWEDRLNYNPQLMMALERGPAAVFKRAELTDFQARAVELMLDGKSATEIGVALGITRQAAQDRIGKAMERILALDRDHNPQP